MSIYEDFTSQKRKPMIGGVNPYDDFASPELEDATVKRKRPTVKLHNPMMDEPLEQNLTDGDEKQNATPKRKRPMIGKMPEIEDIIKPKLEDATVKRKRPMIGKLPEADYDEEHHKDNKLQLNDMIKDAYMMGHGKIFEYRPFRDALNAKYHHKSKKFTNFLKEVVASRKPLKNKYGEVEYEGITENKLNELRKIYDL